MIPTEKMKFSIEDFFAKCDQIRSSCGFGHLDLVTFTEGICDGELHFLCSLSSKSTSQSSSKIKLWLSDFFLKDSCENNWQLKTVKYFRKKLHRKCFTWS